jgi:hypothetical protein
LSRDNIYHKYQEVRRRRGQSDRPAVAHLEAIVSDPEMPAYTEITRCSQKKYGPRVEAGRRITAHIEELWKEFVKIADPKTARHAAKELCSEDRNKYYQRYWEILLGRHLQLCGLSPRATSKGPDFHATRDQLTIWIEAVAPTKGTEQILVAPDEMLSSNYLNIPSYQTDHYAILRRWTQVLKDKYEKLQDYLDSGMVKPDQACVIAINSCLLWESDDALHGPSDLRG